MKLKRIDFVHPITIGDLGVVTGVAFETQGRKFDIELKDDGFVYIGKKMIPLTNVRACEALEVPAAAAPLKK
jgi:hypothetical protein